jgi:phospholipase C
VPTWIVSPWARRSHIETRLYEHSSILKLIERTFGLPTLASINHQFDASTPGGGNNEASGGAPTGLPAPPRDGLGAIVTCTSASPSELRAARCRALNHRPGSGT